MKTVVKVDSWYLVRIDRDGSIEYVWAGYDECEAHAIAQRLQLFGAATAAATLSLRFRCGC